MSEFSKAPHAGTLVKTNFCWILLLGVHNYLQFQTVNLVLIIISISVFFLLSYKSPKFYSFCCMMALQLVLPLYMATPAAIECNLIILLHESRAAKMQLLCNLLYWSSDHLCLRKWKVFHAWLLALLYQHWMLIAQLSLMFAWLNIYLNLLGVMARSCFYSSDQLRFV